MLYKLDYCPRYFKFYGNDPPIVENSITSRAVKCAFAFQGTKRINSKRFEFVRTYTNNRRFFIDEKEAVKT